MCAVDGSIGEARHDCLIPPATTTSSFITVPSVAGPLQSLPTKMHGAEIRALSEQSTPLKGMKGSAGPLRHLTILRHLRAQGVTVLYRLSKALKGINGLLREMEGSQWLHRTLEGS